MREEKPLRLAISCGGTGGHFYPGLSVARTLKTAGGDAVLLLSGVNSESQAATAACFGVRAIELAPMPSPSKLRNAPRFCKGLLLGTRQAARVLREFAPDAMLVMGSFASFPPFLAAKRRGLPVYLHDGNARIGRTNRWLSRFGARALWTAFPAVNASAAACPVSTLGMPLRPELSCGVHPSKAEAIAELNRRFSCNFAPDAPTLLVFGGSLGALFFNRMLPEVVASMHVRRPMQVIHLSGPGKLAELARAYETTPVVRFLASGCEEMQLLYAAADLAVCRSGGSTVAELAAFGVPALLVPLPGAAEHHQHDNAHYLSDAGAALLLDGTECTPEKLFDMLSLFYDEPERLRLMRTALKKLAHPDAASDLTDAIAADLARTGARGY